MSIWNTILADLTYRPGVRLRYYAGKLEVTLVDARDARARGTQGFTFTWDVDPGATADEVLASVGTALLAVEAHEVRELLKYRGRRVMPAHKGDQAEVEVPTTWGLF